MLTSRYSSDGLSRGATRYWLVRGAVGTARLGWWALSRALLMILGVLRLVASPASSGRTRYEFQDLVQADSPENLAARRNNSDAFWQMYFQAYTPRTWRMRRLLTMSVGQGSRRGDGADQEPEQ